jgi:uncharacterized YigZ family protein
MDKKRYPIPCARCRCETEVQRSVFITTISPVSTSIEAATFISEMKAEFPDANHNCWAYLVGPPGSSDRIGLSDDGEPHGAAGKPLLTCLQHSGIGDIAIVVSRYFGGIKLGKGGMVKAYTLAAQNGLSELSIGEKIDWQTLEFVCDYSLLQQIELLLPRFEGNVLERTFAEAVHFVIRCPEEQTDGLSAALVDLSQGQITISRDQ